MNQNILESSGIVALPLLIFSILSLALIAERCYFWGRVLKKQETTLKKIFSLLNADWSLANQALKKT